MRLLSSANGRLLALQCAIAIAGRHRSRGRRSPRRRPAIAHCMATASERDSLFVPRLRTHAVQRNILSLGPNHDRPLPRRAARDRDVHRSGRDSVERRNVFEHAGINHSRVRHGLHASGRCSERRRQRCVAPARGERERSAEGQRGARSGERRVLAKRAPFVGHTNVTGAAQTGVKRRHRERLRRVNK